MAWLLKSYPFATKLLFVVHTRASFCMLLSSLNEPWMPIIQPCTAYRISSPLFNAQHQKSQRMRQFSVSCISNISIIVEVFEFQMLWLFVYAFIAFVVNVWIPFLWTTLLYLLFVGSYRRLRTQMQLWIKFITHINFPASSVPMEEEFGLFHEIEQRENLHIFG